MIALLVSLVMAYITGIVLFYSFIIILGVVLFIFNLLITNIIPILTILSTITAISLLRDKISLLFKAIITKISTFNNKLKPKNILSMRKYGIISIFIGVIGIIIFYANDLPYIVVIYIAVLLQGIYQVIKPQKALKFMYK